MYESEAMVDAPLIKADIRHKRQIALPVLLPVLDIRPENNANMIFQLDHKAETMLLYIKYRHLYKVNRCLLQGGIHEKKFSSSR
jgi:hypothetical protein